MELTRKQIILIAGISGAILLLTLAAALIFTPGEEDALPEPTATPEETAVPVPTPSPTSAPSPTAFRLPLVPQVTAQPAESPGVGVFAPQDMTPVGTAGPWVDAYR